MVNILVIDDDRIVRRSLKDALQLAGGYHVTVAEDGYKGLKMARSNPPDLIICDIEMPRLDGYGVVEKLQRDAATARIPFIFLTGREDRGSMRQGMMRGADDYITKPFKVDELLQAVSTRLAKRDLIEEHYEQKMEVLRDNILLAIPHELRTPMSIVIGYADILNSQVEKLSAEQIGQMAGKIKESGKRLNRLIENYIVYAQIELLLTDPARIQQMRSFREAKPDEVVPMAAQYVMARYGRSAHLDLQAPEAILPIATNNLEKIVEELVDNAFKFSAPETAVSVATWIQDHTFQLEVCNQGRGMTPKQIQDIGVYMQFERKIHEQQGAGLGLIIAKRLSELYGGNLAINSTPGGKTRVTVTLPA